MNKALNIPNAVTFVRLLLIIPFLYFLFLEDLIYIIFLFTIFIIFDILDGWLAVKLNQKTKFGKNFDFVTDLLFGIGAFIILILTNRIPIIILTLVLINSIIMGILVFLGFRKSKVIHNSRQKKIAAVIDFSFLFLLVLNIYNIWTLVLIYLALAYMYYHSFDYYLEIKKKFL